jgi:hypothetical protein
MDDKLKSIIESNVEAAVQEAGDNLPLHLCVGSTLISVHCSPSNHVIRLELQPPSPSPFPRLYLYACMMGDQDELDIMREAITRIQAPHSLSPTILPGQWVYHLSSTAKSRDVITLLPLSVLSLLAPGFTPILGQYGYTPIPKLGPVFALCFHLELNDEDEPVASISLMLADNSPGLIVSIEADPESVYSLTVRGTVGPVQ